ncbi:hypothetical protein NHX12_024274 [Muraenolepis orangiensis]|uniref:EF-hand domain-containing protein n=1 Tax=Muraenolepis orangiensis TaxID=630683 RepID=A0A9Q0ITQ5_9TELE|nr:hypothetical protein NHX12_024274 [Muraenolepis orangiensis]
MAKQPTALECGLAILHSTFQKYAGTDGDNKTISKKELSAMLKEQLPMLAGDECVTALMETLDQDKSGTLDFMEYCVMITTLCSFASGHMPPQ